MLAQPCRDSCCCSGARIHRQPPHQQAQPDSKGKSLYTSRSVACNLISSSSMISQPMTLESGTTLRRTVLLCITRTSTSNLSRSLTLPKHVNRYRTRSIYTALTLLQMHSSRTARRGTLGLASVCTLSLTLRSLEIQG